MPFRPQTLDTGFTAYQAKAPEPVAPESNSSLTGLGALITGDMETFNRVTDRSIATFGAAFRMENDVVNTVSLLTRPQFAADPNFDVAARLKADGLWNDYSENFLGVESEQDYLQVSGRIAQEEKDRLTLSSAGMGGFLAQMAAGLISPTALLPFVGGARGAKAIGLGIGAGFAGGALQEAPLQLAQETRSLNESVSSVAMSTLVGGLLGGAVAFARRTPDEIGELLVPQGGMALEPNSGAISTSSQVVPAAQPGFVRFYHGGGKDGSLDAASLEDLWVTPSQVYARDYRSGGTPNAVYYVDVPEDRLVELGLRNETNGYLQMAKVPRELAQTASVFEIPETVGAGTGRATSAGAQARLEEAPELASAFGLEKSVGQISPVVRVLQTPLAQGRWMMAQLADAGLEFKDRAIAAVGGNVENRIKTYYGPVDKVMRGMDDAYARYWFGGGVKKPLAVTRATLAGMNPNRVKMSKPEFKRAISLALQNGDQSDIPEVAEIAQALRKEIYDPLHKLAQEVGLLKKVEGDAEVPGDQTYLNRVYDIDTIQARQPEFERILAAHYETKVANDFQAAFAKLNQTASRLNERADDFSRPLDEVVKLREEFETRLRGLDEGRDEDLVELEDAISDQRAVARSFPSGSKERAAATAEARALEQEGGEALVETRASRAEIRRRLSNLRRAHSQLTSRQEAKLDKVARAEELSFNTLTQLVRKGQKVLADFDNLSDVKLDAELSKLKTSFAQTAARYDKNELSIATIFDDEFDAGLPTSPFAQAAKVESETFDKMSSVAEAIDDLEVFDRVVARAQVEAGLADATRRAQSIVERRAVRNSRLADQAEALDPEAAAARVEGLRSDSRLKRQEFMDTWRERGADDIDPVSGQSNFKNVAADMARQTTNKILGTFQRLPGMDIIAGPRGAELARVLDIDSKLLVSEADGRNFLEMDAEKLMMSYVRTMAPDIELQRAFGDDFLGANSEGALGLNENWRKLDDEHNARLQGEIASMKAGVNPETGKAKAYSQEAIDKRASALNKEYKDVRRDMGAVIGRLRHTWGVPKDPRGFGARAAKIASNVNVLRFMSNVAISSIPDLARPIMKYGLLRTFRDGYVPFLRSLGEMNFTPRQLRIMGAALDVSLHSRSSQVYDIGDYMVRGSKFEKGLDAATSKIGLVGLFDYWTASMKQITGSVANAKAMDAIELLAGGGKGSQKDIDEATRFLAANGIDDEYARRIWSQLETGGGERVGGQMWPNTEDWTDADAVTAYNAMVVREVDNAIVTPGVERPLMVDANPYQRLLFQFKSFGMSSTTKTFLAGAQGMRQGDMAFVTGGIISLALGTLSYYTYANIVGGKTLEKMQKAIAEGDYAVFADEAINRAGLLGIGADIQSAFAAIPATAPYVTFSGERSSRRGGSNLLETLAGPTFGDLANTGANVLTGIDKPTEATVGQLRSLLPFQNHFLLRQFYDMIEAAAGGLPERRQ